MATDLLGVMKSNIRQCAWTKLRRVLGGAVLFLFPTGMVMFSQHSLQFITPKLMDGLLYNRKEGKRGFVRDCNTCFWVVGIRIVQDIVQK